MDFEEIKRAVLELDDAVLSLENLQQLQTFLPTSEELNLIKDYPGES